jgi:hypothetical protein
MICAGPGIRRKALLMTSAAYELVVIFLAAGFVVGWYANRAYAAHSGVKSAKQRLPGMRRTRHQNGIVAFLLAAGIVMAIVVLLHHVRLK